MSKRTPKRRPAQEPRTLPLPSTGLPALEGRARGGVRYARPHGRGSPGAVLPAVPVRAHGPHLDDTTFAGAGVSVGAFSPVRLAGYPRRPSCPPQGGGLFR